MCQEAESEAGNQWDKATASLGRQSDGTTVPKTSSPNKCNADSDPATNRFETSWRAIAAIVYTFQSRFNPHVHFYDSRPIGPAAHPSCGPLTTPGFAAKLRYRRGPSRQSSCHRL